MWEREERVYLVFVCCWSWSWLCNSLISMISNSYRKTCNPLSRFGGSQAHNKPLAVTRGWVDGGCQRMEDGSK